ncbi:MAG TPA: polyphenol oxidase family protein [Thermoleophilaceae bacterium]|nr:polyphenol oxidase family protein [Thermoleophilaceae bacterium]
MSPAAAHRREQAALIEVALPGARVAFSTRHGGVSEGPYESLNLGILTDDRPGRVARNRAILAERAGLHPDGVAMGWQVHGSEIREWSARPGEVPFASRASGPDDDLARVDGHVTSAEGLGLLVLVADCLPVALAGPDRVAMLHCGWRGLAAEIVERALVSFPQPPAAAIGPGIGACCYQVGDEVLAAFEGLDGVTEQRMLDLREIARRKLRAGGVEHIEDVGLCTSCRPDLFFSHRRDQGVTGRQAGLVWRA